MKKLEVIRTVLAACADALYTKLEAEEYTEFLNGSVTFRLDLIRKPETIFVGVNLPGRSDPKMRIEFKRPYARRQFIEISPETVEEVNAVEN